jgi:predicted MFS family arabinose efflux permease
MISKTASLYKQAYRGLSRETWLLSGVMLVNRSGTMVLPFMTLYLTRPEMGYSIEQAGYVMGCFGLGAILGAHISGRLTDKIGFYPLQLVTLLGGGVLFMVLGQMQSYPLICLFTFLLSLVNEAFRPANSTAIAHYSEIHNRTRSYALNRLAINLGWAVGNAIGGLVAAYKYEWLFWLDGTTNILAAILLWIFLRPAKSSDIAKPIVKEPVTSVYRDKIYLVFIVFAFLFASCFFQLFTNMPAYYRNDLGFSEKFIGLLGAVNGLMIAMVEMVIVFKLEGRRAHTYYIGRGILLCGLAFALIAAFKGTPVLALSMMLLITMGEILSMPFMNSFWIARSSPANRGQYAGLYTMAWASAQTLGPILGSQLAGHQGFRLLWWILAGICILTAAAVAWLHRYMQTQQTLV